MNLSWEVLKEMRHQDEPLVASLTDLLNYCAINRSIRSFGEMEGIGQILVRNVEFSLDWLSLVRCSDEEVQLIHRLLSLGWSLITSEFLILGEWLD